MRKWLLSFSKFFTSKDKTLPATEYEFTRYRNINGKERVQTVTSHYSYSEAQSADLFSKDTYKKYARIMIGHRAFVLGARDIANDLLMGCMETTELKVVENAPITDVDFVEVSES